MATITCALYALGCVLMLAFVSVMSTDSFDKPIPRPVVAVARRRLAHLCRGVRRIAGMGLDQGVLQMDTGVMATCAYLPQLDDLDDPALPSRCNGEATHDRECTQGAAPVCAEHTCRCSRTFAERARIDESRRIPQHWMAL